MAPSGVIHDGVQIALSSYVLKLSSIFVWPRRRQQTPRVWLWLVTSLWLSGAATGLWAVWAYDNGPGERANAPQRWPSETRLTLAGDRPTVVLLAHPQCDCTRATLGELAEVLARTPTLPITYVLFLRPAGFSAGWEQTDLWRTAASLPRVTVLRDDEGVEAQRFGVATSGETLVYDQRGMLRFSGGITGSRGHAGDNAGRATLLALLNDGLAAQSSTSVFGCPLFDSGR
jgi:hypothetical protein